MGVKEMKIEIVNKEFNTIRVNHVILYDQPCEIVRAIEYLLQENEDLKLQLKGTTHCYDEEEHRKLNAELEVYRDAFHNEHRLTHILNYLEYWLKEKRKISCSIPVKCAYIEVLDKLKELKGNDE